MDLREYFRNRDMIGVQEDELTEEQKNLACITIDGNVIGGYGSYSFVRVVEYVSEPQRSSDGKISNLDGYTTFITPKVKLHFNAISIDGYRLLMNLITSKREFYVGCYDFVSDKWVHQNMYFYPNDYPEIFQYDLQVLAVLNFDIELIGTNTNNENIVITLNSNYPSNAYADSARTIALTSSNYNLTDVYQNEYFTLSYPKSVFDADKTIYIANDSSAYSFWKWNTRPNGTGVSYLDGTEVAFSGNTTLYAIWSSGREKMIFHYYNGEDNIMDLYYESGTTFDAFNTPELSNYTSSGGTEMLFAGWFTNDQYTSSLYNKKFADLPRSSSDNAYHAYAKFTARPTPNPNNAPIEQQ